MNKLHVTEVWVVNPETDERGDIVMRYALVDGMGIVWINGRSFGSITDMTKHDHSTCDCRHLFRRTPEEAAKDAGTWYDVIDGRIQER